MCMANGLSMGFCGDSTLAFVLTLNSAFSEEFGALKICFATLQQLVLL